MWVQVPSVTPKKGENMLRVITACLSAFLLTGCAFFTPSFKSGNKQTMVASWYEHGTRTANGERFNPDGLTVAHKKLPFNTKIALTRGDKTIIVRVTDRGPFVRGRDLDLSRGAAKALGCIKVGVCTLQAEIL